MVLEDYKTLEDYMQQSASFLLVSVSKLPRYPKAFQAYVHEFFDDIYINGELYKIAFPVLSLRRSGMKGVAPSHSVDLSRYTEGLPQGKGLNEWIRDQVQNPKSGIMRYGQTWDDGCSGHPVEVD